MGLETTNLNFISPINRSWPVNRGLVARYKVAAKGGLKLRNLAASKANDGTDGTLTNTNPAAAWSASNRPGSMGALSLDATDDFVTVPTTSALDPLNITVSCWVYIRSYAGNAYQQLVGKANSSWTAGWAMVLHPESSGKLEFWLNGYALAANSNANTARTSVPLSTWTHLCGTYDGATVALYVNGISVNTMAYATGLTATSNNLVMGFVSGLAPFDGLLDEVCISNRAHSAQEVKLFYEDMRLGSPRSLNWARQPRMRVAAAAASGGMGGYVLGGGMGGRLIAA